MRSGMQNSQQPKSSPSRLTRSISRTLVCLLLASLSPIPLPAQNPPLQPVPPRDSLSLNAQVYPFQLPDRETIRDIARADKELLQGNTVEAIRLLQNLINSREDVLLPPENLAQPVIGSSLHRSIIDIMSKVAPEALQAYETQIGGEAKARIEEARQADDWNTLSQLSRSYLFTDAGRKITEEIAARHLDHGRFCSAALVYERLLISLHSQGNVPPRSVALLAFCYLQSGQRDLAMNLLVRYQDALQTGTIEWGTDRWKLPLTTDQLLQDLTKPRLSPLRIEQPRDWLTPRQSNDRQSLATVPPIALQERWTLPTTRWKDAFGEDSSLEEDLDPQDPLDDLFHRSASRNLPLLPSAIPLIVDDIAIFRTVRQLHAVHLTTGKTRWRSAEIEPSLNFLQQQLSPATQQAGTRRQIVVAALETRAWNNSTHGSLTSDGDRVYSLEDLGFWENSNGPNNFHESNSLAPRDFNRLVANDLRTGKIIWEIGRPADATGTELAGYFFLGPPLCLEGVLYVLAEHQRELQLVALAPETGQQLWKQALLTYGQGVFTDIPRRSAGLIPTASEGILLCPTGTESLMAVDLTAHSILWASRPDTNSIPADVIERRIFPQGQLLPMLSYLPILDRWIDTHVQLVGDRILYAPRESDFLFCLQLSTGQVLWQLPRDRGVFIAGHHAEKVLIIGRELIEAIHLSDGKPAWKEPIPITAVSGRGFFANGLYHLPLMTGELLSIDLQRGLILARRQFQGEKPLGNLIAARGLVLSQSYDTVTAFKTLEDRAVEQGVTLDKPPTDAPGWALRGLLHLYHQQPGKAYSDFYKSWETEHQTSIVDTWLASLAEGLRQDPEHYRDFIDINHATPALTSRWGGVWGYHASAEFMRRGEFQNAAKLLALLLPTDEHSTLTDRIGLDWSVRREDWLATRFAELFRTIPANQIPDLEKQLREEWHKREKNPVARRRIQSIFRDLPIGRELALLELNDSGTEIELTAEKELWLLRTLPSVDPTLTPLVTAQLARGLLTRGDTSAALPSLARLNGEFADKQTESGLTGSEVYSKLQLDPLWKESLPLTDWPSGKLTLHVRQFDSNEGIQNIPTPLFVDLKDQADLRFQIHRDSDRVRVLDARGITLGEHSLTSSFGYRSGGQWFYSRLGPILILTNAIQVAALDLSRIRKKQEISQLWSQELIDPFAGPFDTDNRHNHERFGDLQISPVRVLDSSKQWGGILLCSTPEILLIYKNQSLMGFDPLSGSLRWQRHFVQSLPQAVAWNRSILIQSDSTNPYSCTLLSATDGSWLQNKTLASNSPQASSPGNQIPDIHPKPTLSLTPTHNGFLLRERLADQSERCALIDPVSLEPIWEKRFPSGSEFSLGHRLPGRELSAESGEEISILSPGGLLEVVNLQTGLPRFQTRLTEADAPTPFTFLSTPENDLILLGTYPIPSTFVQQFAWGRGSIDYGGTLLALDRSTGSLLWKKKTPSSSKLIEVSASHPVLVIRTQEQKVISRKNGPTSHLPIHQLFLLDRRSGREFHQVTDPSVVGLIRLQSDVAARTLKFVFGTILQQNKLQLDLTFTDDALGNGTPDTNVILERPETTETPAKQPDSDAPPKPAPPASEPPRPEK